MMRRLNQTIVRYKEANGFCALRPTMLKNLHHWNDATSDTGYNLLPCCLMFGSTAKHLRTYYFQKGQLEQSILRHHTGRELIVVPPLCLHQIKSNSCSAQNRKIGRLISNEARSFFGLPRIRNILIQTWQKFRCCLSFFVSVQNWINRFFPENLQTLFFPKKLAPKNCFQSKVVEAEVFKR